MRESRPGAIPAPPILREWGPSSPASPRHRHQKIRESAQELLGRLRDNWELQKFLQDGQEVRRDRDGIGGGWG